MRKFRHVNSRTGVIKEVDNLGRIVIPKEMRDLYKLNERVEVISTPEGVLIRNPQYILVKIKEDLT